MTELVVNLTPEARRAIRSAIKDIVQLQAVLAPLSATCDAFIDVLMACANGKISEEQAESAKKVADAIPPCDFDGLGRTLASACEVIEHCIEGDLYT
jgi:hypothetical protein